MPNFRLKVHRRAVGGAWPQNAFRRGVPAAIPVVVRSREFESCGNHTG
jgi:hypothetical protein